MKFENLNPKVTFIIFQVHSHLYNVSVYNNSLNSKTLMHGTNIGFYSPVKSLDTFFIVNPNNVDLKLYISVHGYSESGKFPPLNGFYLLHHDLGMDIYVICVYRDAYMMNLSS